MPSLESNQVPRDAGRISVGIIEDDPIMGGSLFQRLGLEGYEPVWWRSGGEALEALDRQVPDIVVCDIRLPDMSGEDVFDTALRQLGGTPVIFITGHAEIDQAVRLMRKGADEYMTKPFEIDTFLGHIAALAGSHGIKPEDGGNGLGLSRQMRQVEKTLQSISDIDSGVLLTGESGSGKEVAARYLHRISDRAQAPFIAVNCAAIPAELMESELLGHEAGAFTGAKARHRGYAERAGGGILFLDEVGDLPAPLQGKLLHLLQNRAFTRVGGEREQEFNARVVCATNRDLKQAVGDGDFREDLYYRINVIPITIPPLRDHPDDILPLVRGYMEHFSQRFQRDIRSLTPAAEEAVLAHDWPGNVRELRNRIERAIALGAGRRLRTQDVFADSNHASKDDELPTLQQVRDAAEARHIRRALDNAGGSTGIAADVLGISRTTLWEKMKKLGIGD